MGSAPSQAICDHSAALFCGPVSACTTQSPRGDGSGISCGPKTSLTVSQLVTSIRFALVTVSLEIVTMVFRLSLHGDVRSMSACGTRLAYEHTASAQLSKQSGFSPRCITSALSRLSPVAKLLPAPCIRAAKTIRRVGVKPSTPASFIRRTTGDFSSVSAARPKTNCKQRTRRRQKRLSKLWATKSILNPRSDEL